MLGGLNMFFRIQNEILHDIHAMLHTSRRPSPLQTFQSQLDK